MKLHTDFRLKVTFNTIMNWAKISWFLMAYLKMSMVDIQQVLGYAVPT
jgi:hypothetical protein